MSELIARLMAAIETPDDLTQEDVNCLLEDAHIALRETEDGNKRKIIDECLQEQEISTLTMDGLDDALLGLSTRMNEPTVAVYSQSKIIEILVKDGMSHEEAYEHFGFNIAGSYMGAETPTIVDDTMFYED